MATAKGQRPIATESHSSYSLRMAYDANFNVEYTGKADIGTATSASGWQVKKFIYDVNDNLTNVMWADGDDAFDNVWDNRTSLSYS